MSDRPAALVVGVGPGLGFALVRRFARAGMAVAMAARAKGHLDQLLEKEPVEGASAYACDATDQASVGRLFEEAGKDLGFRCRPARSGSLCLDLAIQSIQIQKDTDPSVTTGLRPGRPP